MRKSMPMQWIEESEAADVLAEARFKHVPSPSVGEAAGAVLADWLGRAHSWLAPQLPAAWPTLQAQPVLVRRTEGLRVRRPSVNDNYYRCNW